ncbi:MAG: hypothetical protein WAP35_05165 [Solirubrobacterales bacterium]
MADLTNLESKLAEVLGLAQASKGATDKISKMVAEEDADLAAKVEQMGEEAAETEVRCTAYADALEGKKTAILDAARETKGEATKMMETYLGADSDGLDGLEFMMMAEAGEVGHWEILAQLNEQAGDQELQQLIDWALPIQQNHLQCVRDGSLKLAAKEDALAAA